MLQSIEGIYKNGKVELAELPSDVSESRVIVTFLEPRNYLQHSQIMTFGMFSGENQSTEDDFGIAEFHGDREDYLDWSK
ncbi:hypothetical protein H6G80_24715 [Nostoc sp. FACHB-87]|uniref:hypothetical protein n=1 Tax=Nostocaceae TaxID=1162 RepID=UPI001685B1A9|nr:MULTISPECIES: hypothetical protein [Nostocaceae]MBD2301353.1 hypothetical protein [Nostoc sp. FACHB-190]MBD2457267.1 hypothetical protein [Nostoc sp. FACHB-87]MBD2477728.1 hypothetical protein [Anabaena sp. FACHB-83]MBD2498156.1 hypothetical protein [Nostoc sp. FACHB-280]